MARPAKGQVLERKGKRGRVYALRFYAYGRREYVTLAAADDGWTRQKAEAELANVLADVRRGIWRPAEPEPVVEGPAEAPTFHLVASEWIAARKLDGLRPRTIEHLTWALTTHLLPAFARYHVDAITPQRVDAYRAAKVREREEALVDRPLSNGTINRTIAVLAAVLDQAVEYGHLTTNPARGKRRRLKHARPRRTWLELDEVRFLLDATTGRFSRQWFSAGSVSVKRSAFAARRRPRPRPTDRPNLEDRGGRAGGRPVARPARRAQAPPGR
jgi:integrase